MEKGVLALLITLLFTCFNVIPAFGVDYYEAGKLAYKNKDYSKASENFYKAILEKPFNVNYRYYYAQTLVHLNRLSDAQKEYEKIIELEPNSQAAKLSVIGIANIHDYYKEVENLYRNAGSSLISSESFNSISSLDQSKVKNSYIHNVVNDKGKIIRWSLDNMPIRVYININNKVHGYKPSYAQMVKNALTAWEKANKKLQFSYVQDKSEAQIIITFVSGLDTTNAKTGFIGGLTAPYFKDNRLLYATIDLTVLRPNGEQVLETELYNTALHELGHALGIWGHSNDPADVMNAVQHNHVQKTTQQLTVRDINTINLLYQLTPDISNFSDTELARKDAEKNANLLGGQNTRLETKLKEAVEYVKQLPDNPISWTKLGDVYSNMGKYDNAIKNYSTALELNPGYTDARAGLAAVYKAKGDLKNAALHYEQLVKSNPKNIDYSYNLADIYMKSNLSMKAKNVISTLIRNNSEAASNENIKQIRVKLGI